MEWACWRPERQNSGMDVADLEGPTERSVGERARPQKRPETIGVYTAARATCGDETAWKAWNGRGAHDIQRDAVT